MRHFVLAIMISFAIFVGVCHAQDALAPAGAKGQEQPQVVKAKKYREVPVDRNGDTKIDGVDIYDEQGRLVRKGFDENGDGMNDKYLDYDPNTGMPMVAASDQEFR